MPALTLTREFHFRLTIGRTIELKRLDLLDVFELPQLPEQIATLIGDPQRIAQLLYEMTDKTGWSFDNFAELLDSLTPEQKWEALKTTIEDFFPRSLKPWISGLFDAVNAARNVMAKRMLDSLTENELTDAEESIDETGTGFGNWQGSSVSIPVPSLIENSTSWPSADNVPSGVEQAS